MSDVFDIAFWKTGSLPNNFMSRTQTRKESSLPPPPTTSSYWERPGCSRWTAFQNPADLEWQECSRFQLQVPGIKPDSLRPGGCKHTRRLLFTSALKHIRRNLDPPTRRREQRSVTGSSGTPAGTLSPHLHKSRMSAAAL